MKLTSKTNEHLCRRNVDLSSDLLIKPLCNGQFSAEMHFNAPNKEIFLHVCRKRIDVFYKEKKGVCDLNFDEDVILKGHVYLPMFINTDTYEFSFDDSHRLHITAAIQGSILLPPSNSDAPVQKRKLPLVKSMSDCRLSEFLHKKFSKRSRAKSDSATVLASSVKSGNPIEDTVMSEAESGAQKSAIKLITGSTTVNGIFKPFQLSSDDPKRRSMQSICRWEI